MTICDDGRPGRTADQNGQGWGHGVQLIGSPMAVPLVVFGKWIGGMLFRPDDDVHTATVPDPKYWKESREIYGAMSSWRWGGKNGFRSKASLECKGLGG